MNQTERNIGKLLKSLEADGYITIENAGPKRIIRLTEKLSQMWTEFCKSMTAEFTSYPEQTGALTDDVTPNNRSTLPRTGVQGNSEQFKDVTPNNRSTLPRTDVQAYPEQLGNSTEDETGLKALTGMPSDGAGKIPTLIYTKEDTIKKESEAFASLHFVPVVSQKKERKPYQTKKCKAQSNVPLTEEDVKFRLALKPIIEHKDFLPAWNAFKENCHAKRSPVSDARKELLLKDLLQFSGGNPAKAISILQETVKGGWSKFYAPKYNAGKSTVFLQDRPPEEKIKKVVWGQKIKP